MNPKKEHTICSRKGNLFFLLCSFTQSSGNSCSINRSRNSAKIKSDRWFRSTWNYFLFLSLFASDFSSMWSEKIEEKWIFCGKCQSNLELTLLRIVMIVQLLKKKKKNFFIPFLHDESNSETKLESIPVHSDKSFLRICFTEFSIDNFFILIRFVNALRVD